ncbi:hypothetical protein C8R43DRAFT_1137171 [Mycena crocata]|nr:hypothetical protein C8R43DRAFT_1137171 [Mycena crocata]
MDNSVTFTYYRGTERKVKDLPLQEMIPSREAVGVWHVDDRSWKVYATTDQYARISEDYNRAAAYAGLPMGKPMFIKGIVKIPGRLASSGFILSIEWMTGTPFHYGDTFRTALQRQNISHNVQNEEYKRVLGGCNAASQVGLTDCQGFVQHGQYVYEPLCFIDVHTSWNQQTGRYNPSAAANALVETIRAWAN